MQRNRPKVDASDPVSRFVDQFGSKLCWLAFLITGDWQLGVEAVVGVLDSEGVVNQFSPEWTLLWARRLVAAASVALISRDLSESACRAAESAGTNPTMLTGHLRDMCTCRPAPTTAELEKALLGVDVFPRCAVLLTVLEGLSIEDAVLLLNADEALVRGARTLGLVELVRRIALSPLLFGSRN